MMKQFEQSELLKSLPKQFFASLVGKVGKVMAQGHDVINLGQGNPDQPTPSHIVETLQKVECPVLVVPEKFEFPAKKYP